jgi:hypothetical protein
MYVLFPFVDIHFPITLFIVGSKKPSLSFSSSNGPAMSDNMRRFADGMRGCNSKLEIYHMVLVGAAWDVWGFNFKHYDDYYWSWKPNVLEKAIIAERGFPLFDDEGTTMDDILHNIRAAAVRETPCGENIAAAYVYKQGKRIDREMLFGLLPSPSSEEIVKNITMDVFNHFTNPKIQSAYGVALENTINSTNMVADVKVNGPLWEKLKAAAKNISFKKLSSLNEVFLDVKIEEIIRLSYGMTGGEAPSMWGEDIVKLAFGSARD